MPTHTDALAECIMHRGKNVFSSIDTSEVFISWVEANNWIRNSYLVYNNAREIEEFEKNKEYLRMPTPVYPKRTTVQSEQLSLKQDIMNIL